LAKLVQVLALHFLTMEFTVTDNWKFI